MDPTGLLDKIIEAATIIDYGRKGFATRGKAEEGRLSYERGIFAALSAFKDAQSTIDPHIIILTEYTFLAQELQFCDKTDMDSFGSLTQAIQSFDDAFLVLEVVEDSTLYKAVDQSFPRNKKYREKSFPKDSYHIACKAHRTRLKNILRSPGIDPIEKTLLKQRFANLTTGQKGYCEKQRKAILI
ncbi:MAG: hypothetical protein FWB83_10590 [Treponema sp.]|nr:hypothetical protein [Treponema sp.]